MARGCSIMDRDAKTAPHEPDQSWRRSARRPRGELWRGTVRGAGETSPRRGRTETRDRSAARSRRASRPRRRRPRSRRRAAPWGILRAKDFTREGPETRLNDQGSTAPVRTLALASFSLLTFLSSFFLSSFLPLSSFLASLSSPFLEESLESLDLSLSSLALESFFSSFLTAFSSCVRRARDGVRAARGAVDAKNHHAIAAIGASRRHRERTFFFSFSLALAFSALSYSSALFCLR